MTFEMLPLPTVISTSVILNAMVRGAEKATETLGSDYFTVVHKDFMTPLVTVHRVEPETVDDILSTTQAQPMPEAAIWSMKLTEQDMTSSDNTFFKANPLKYFFLTRDEALSYIDAIENAVTSLVIKAANKTTNKGS